MSKPPPALLSHWPDTFSNAVRQIRAPLIANSIYLLAGSFLSAALAFIFWIIAARLIASEEVGLVVAANSAINILVLLSDLGLGSAIVRFASSEKETAVEIINSSVAIVWIASVLLSVIFIFCIPFLSPGLRNVRDDSFLSISFVLFTSVISLLNLQVAAMLARRRGGFSFWRYSIASFFSIPFLLIFSKITSGVNAAFLSLNLPNVLIFLVTSIFALPLFFQGYKVFGHLNLDNTLKLTRYTSANYIATLLWQIPIFALPLISSNVISAEATAYFYLPWIIAISILSIPQMVSLSLFAEGSYNTNALFSLVRKATIFIAILVTPIILVLWFWGGSILELIGKDYANAYVLRLILISIIPYTINSIYTAYLRVSMQLKRLLALSFTMFISALGLAYILGSVFGGVGLAIGWSIGQTIASTTVLMMYEFDRIRARRCKI
jgi:O-antigen/teichoic acid export membrane protein